MPLSPESRLDLSPNVVARVVDESMALLDCHSGAYFTVNDVGSRFVEMAQNGATVSEAAQAIAEEYDVSADEALTDLLELADSLLAEGLVTLRAAAAP